jgi:hypothetical protein
METDIAKALLQSEHISTQYNRWLMLEMYLAERSAAHYNDPAILDKAKYNVNARVEMWREATASWDKDDRIRAWYSYQKWINTLIDALVHQGIIDKSDTVMQSELEQCRVHDLVN